MAFTWPVPWVPDASGSEDLGGTTPGDVKIPYIAKGVDSSSSPTFRVQFNRIAYMLRKLGFDPGRGIRTSGGTRHIGVFPRWYRKSDETAVLFEGANNFELTSNATNYVYVDHADNVLKKSTSGWPGTANTFVAVGRWVVDSGGNITTPDSEADARGLTTCWPPASSSAPTGTTGTSFTLDSDNAGAGVDQQVRFNRGSTDAEDAALEWDETNDRLNAYRQHTTKTACPVNAEKFQVGGTDVVTGDGAAKVKSDVAGNGLTHAAGVLAVGVDGSTVEISGDQLRLKDAGVTTAKLSNTIADKLVQVSIPDASGASPQTPQIQMLDIQGDNLAEVVYVRVRVCQDEHGAALATNATIAVGTEGTLCRSETAGKDLVCRTNASGQLDITVTDGTAETVYLLCEPTPRSRMMDCADIGTIVIT